MWHWPLPHSVMIPINHHPGAFGFVRKYDIHTGVDLYCPTYTVVSAVEPGVVVNILMFTGPDAGSPWWQPSKAVMIEGVSGVVNYGEIIPDSGLNIGDKVKAGERIGIVVPVLRPDQVKKEISGHSRFMLHLELYEAGTKEPVWWNLNKPKPPELRDPTELLRAAIRNRML